MMPSGAVMEEDTLCLPKGGKKTSGTVTLRESSHTTSIKASSSRATSSTEVLTRVTSNSGSAASSIFGRLQPALDHLGRFGAPPGEPAHQLLPGGRGQEHQLRVRHGLPDLPGALQVDLQEDRLTGLQPLQHRPPRRAVAVAGEFRPLQQLAVGDQLVHLVVGDEEVVDAVLLTGARLAGRGRDREPDLGVFLAHMGDDRALADPRRAGEHGQPRTYVRGHGGRPRNVQPYSDYSSGSRGADSGARCRRTRAPGRRSGWSRDRARGGSRRYRVAP